MFENIKIVLGLAGITGTEKLILFALAIRANENGETWPSLETIMRDTCICDTSGIHANAVSKTLNVTQTVTPLLVWEGFKQNGKTITSLRIDHEVGVDGDWIVLDGITANKSGGNGVFVSETNWSMLGSGAGYVEILENGAPDGSGVAKVKLRINRDVEVSNPRIAGSNPARGASFFHG